MSSVPPGGSYTPPPPPPSDPPIGRGSPAGGDLVYPTTPPKAPILVLVLNLLLAGGVIGAQYGAMLTTRLKPDLLRLTLAVIILLVALRMALGLTYRPDEIFSIEYL